MKYMFASDVHGSAYYCRKMLDAYKEEKAERVKILLDTMQYLYRDIKGRRENLSPLFVIGGRYSRKNPFFEKGVRNSRNKAKQKMIEVAEKELGKTVKE